jgi:hypothetical protein
MIKRPSLDVQMLDLIRIMNEDEPMLPEQLKRAVIATRQMDQRRAKRQRKK